MLFKRRFDDESKKFRKNENQTITTRIQKTNLVKSVKEIVVSLIKNEIEQINKILLKMIEMLKANLKKNIEKQLKLIRTLNRIENKFQKIEKQNFNQSIKAKTYVSVMKTITKITRIENDGEKFNKKRTTTSLTTVKKEK